MGVRKRGSVRTDMTPMVDVAFLLLIFFMTTTQFKPPEHVAIQLPTSASEIHVPETGTIILHVSAAGEVFISSSAGNDIQELQPENLEAAIVDWRERNPNAVMIIKGDKSADFGVVANVMDALAEAKALRFNLMTDLKTRAPGSETE